MRLENRCFGCEGATERRCLACYGAKVERETLARVVAWMRAEIAKGGPLHPVDAEECAARIADAIERCAWKENG